MRIAILILMFNVICFAAFAQKDSVVYFLKNNGKLVSTKDSADYFLVVTPNVPGVSGDLYVVNAYKTNGKMVFLGHSNTNQLKMTSSGHYQADLQGMYTSFFPNGNKRKVTFLENGAPMGDELEYYSNGNLYHKKTYLKDHKVLLDNYTDSTGKILTSNGTGKWIDFNQDFTKIDAEGKLVKGLKDGVWRGRYNDSVRFEYVYKQGEVISSKSIEKSGAEHSFKFTEMESVPEFPGGIEAFYKYLGDNLHYPTVARKNGTQGRVIIQFNVEKDGTLTNIRVVRGIGDGCDEEALRVLRLSPAWKPGIQFGIPVRVQYSVPLSFSLGK